VEGHSESIGPRLLVLGAGPAQLGLLAAARDRGLFVIAVDRDPAAPGFRFADRRAILSAEDAPTIERLASAEHIDGVIAPGIDWPVGIAARVAERLGIPHPVEPASAVLSTSKLRQRERFAEAGVPQSRWKLVTEPDDELGFPCVVKAPDRQGQRGLSLVRDRSELAAAVEEAMASSRTRVCMIEELVDGPEVTVNAFSRAGVFHPLTVTDRLTAEPPAFGVALAHVWPPEHADGAPGVAEAAAEALGIREGPTYTQVRIGPDGPRVIELAARLGGGHDAELCHAALGVDLNGLALAAALGEEIAPEMLAPTPRVGGAVVRFLVAPQGELLEVTGAEEARALEGVVDVRVYRAPGFRFGPLRRGADRAGAVLAVGDSREEALERSARAADLVRFETADAEALV
jgi:biotin carboxylase